MDGTSFTMRRFDEIREDKAYAELIENREKQMASSHAMKRFFHRFSFVMLWHFRWVLQRLFIWRLKIEKPEIIILNIDSMVMHNNDAKKDV